MSSVLNRIAPFQFWISIAALIVAVLAYVSAGRAPTGHATLGFVDMQTVMQQSDAGKSLQSQVGPRQDKLKQAAEAKLKELKQQQDEIAKLAEPDKSARGAVLQKQVNDWNVEAEKQQAILNAAVAPAAQKIEQALREQMLSIAEENGYSAIMPMQSAFYAAKGVDVTSEAIRKLNGKLSKVEVKFDDAAK